MAAVPETAEILTSDARVDFDAAVMLGMAPTVYEWKSAQDTEAARSFDLAVMAAAYDAAVHSALREPGSHRKLDLPVGAAIGDRKTGLIFPGYACDKETDDPDAHAETMTIRGAQAHGVNLRNTILRVSLEPCPACLDRIEDAGIPSVAHASLREDLEAVGLLKFHPEKAEHIVRSAREADPTRYPFELFQYPIPAVRDACLEVFAAFRRDPYTEVVELDPTHNVSRLRGFRRAVDEMRNRALQRNDQIEDTQLPAVPFYERDALLVAFKDLLSSFTRPPSPQELTQSFE